MRPSTLLFISAASLVNAGASVLSTKDVTVTVTSTSTHTVCPLTTLPTTCVVPTAPFATNAQGSSLLNNWLNPKFPAGGASHYWDDWTTTGPAGSGTTYTAKSTVTTTISGQVTTITGNVTTTISGVVTTINGGTVTTTISGTVTTITNGPVTTTISGPITTVTSGTITTTITGNATTTGDPSIGNATITAGGNTTTTAPITSLTPVPINGTTPVNGSTSTTCNTASDRSVWCDGKTIDSDPYKNDYLTGKQCIYNFDITNTTLTFDAKPVLALAINGQSPGPLIECNWGDEVIITVTNSMQDNATTIHWHGIRQSGTNDQDGVPGVTECGIAPGESRTYTWIANTYGTSWYHSHMLTQFGDGLRGPMIIHGPATANYDIDMGTVLISDTFGDSSSGDVTAAQAVWRASHQGPQSTFNYLLNGKNKSPDLTTGEHSVWSVQPGKKHLFRFINGATQNMFSVHFDNHIMTVIAADFVPIVPYTTSWLNIGIGQRYDVIVEMDQAVAGYYLRAVTQTACPSFCTNTGLGDANGIIKYVGSNDTAPTSSYGNVTAADFATCVDEPLASLVPHLTVAPDRSAFANANSAIPAGLAIPVTTDDDGTVFRWFINNAWMDLNFTQPSLQTIATGGNFSSLDNTVQITSVDSWVYFIIANQFFASHPMHLHGHDMSILYQSDGVYGGSSESDLWNWDNPMRRDTIMLEGAAAPPSTGGHTVIGFKTDNPGAWVMHCHIIMHVDGGLALQFIERPSEIPTTFATESSFTDECSALSAWEAQDPDRNKPSSSSGLKRRVYEGLVNGAENVVRRSSDSHKKYLDSFRRRHAHGSS